MQIAEDLVSKRYNLYETAYLIWLKSNDVKTIAKNDENIKQNIVNFFKFFIEDINISERQDVVVAARNTKTFNDVPSNEIFEKLRDHLPISNAMYPRDFPKVLSSKTKIAQTNRDIVIGGLPGPIYNNTTSHNN